MLTGTVGFIFLFVFRKKYYAADKLRFKQWLLIFSSLFWLRQVANFVTWLGGYFIKGKVFGHGDESGIAYHLGFPNWGIAFLTAFIGAIVLALVVFKFIPLKQRFTFIVSGLIGGISGYILWLKLLGPILMP